MHDDIGLGTDSAQPQGWDRQRWSRMETATLLAAYEASAGTNGERARADDQGVPRSTVRYWESRRDEQLAGDAGAAAFFNSPGGTAALHRVVMAAMLVMMFVGPCGVRLVQLFLRLSGLSRYVASSVGSLHKLSKQVEEQVLAFEDEERPRLAAQMAPKSITGCLDETFHPDICLVAMEPVSGFVLLEKYSDKRDAAHWDTAVTDALRGLPVEMVQATSDEARGIIHMVTESLEAHHSPDVFHVQHEVTKATSAPLAAAVRAKLGAVQEASERVSACREAQRVYAEQRRGPGRPPDLDGALAKATDAQHDAGAALADAMANQEQMREVNRGISQAYHPFDLDTGQARSGAALEKRLLEFFRKARQVVVAAGLPERCEKAVAKAGRVVDAMVDTHNFFHRVVVEEVTALHLPATVHEPVLALLIPALYLQRAARKASTAAVRREIEAVATRLMTALQATAWAALDATTGAAILKTAQDCADLFQRSSSCVEGRNGQLALHHHALHRLTAGKLRALTIIHNYFLRRPDGSTAAQRFFGAPHKDLFDWLVFHVSPPPRPVMSTTQSYDA